MTRACIARLICVGLAACTAGCIRPHNYHPGGTDKNKPVFHYDYASAVEYGKGYFYGDDAWEAYVEFDSRGYLYRDVNNRAVQLEETIRRIRQLRHPSTDADVPIELIVFVHGWKNDASEESANVPGFRRFLNHVAAAVHSRSGNEHVPVMGVYIGWPGASTKVGKLFSFWDREPVADAVGAGELAGALKEILAAAKEKPVKRAGEPETAAESKAVVIGHSFGGLVLERAAIQLLREQIRKLDTDPKAESPADLFVLINEAGAAALARPFLMELASEGITYSDDNVPPRPHPLIVSMTSTGDAATKLAYPGGEWVSFNRPATVKFPNTDSFGQLSTMPYNLLTAANMIALQSHDILPKTQVKDACDVTICTVGRNARAARATRNGAKTVNGSAGFGAGGAPHASALQDGQTGCADASAYCIKAKDPIQSRNKTPYWIMQMPQVFVPDHSTIFRDEMITLLLSLLADADITKPAPPTMEALLPPPEQDLNALRASPPASVRSSRVPHFRKAAR